MRIDEIWISQRNLRRFHQVPEMVNNLKKGGYLPRITLMLCEDGEVQVEDGHHRLMAYWLAGWREIDKSEYLLLEKEQWKPRRGKLSDIIDNCDL